jgi:hypothetical protein
VKTKKTYKLNMSLKTGNSTIERKKEVANHHKRARNHDR